MSFSEKSNFACLALSVTFFVLTVVSVSAQAATNIFFMPPVSGQQGSSVRVPLVVKGERLQSGAIDFLYDSRYVSPGLINGNLVRVDRGPLAEQGAPFFFAASVLEPLFDATRPYLRTIRFSFAFQTPVNSAGAGYLAYFHFDLDVMPPGGVTLLQVIRNMPSMGDLLTYRQGGGAIFFDNGTGLPDVSIQSPENERRYEESNIILSAVTGASAPETPQPRIFWVNPFAITEPLGTDLVVAQGPYASLEYETGVHVLVCVALGSDGNAGTDWSVFGVREDVVVTVLGAINATVVDYASGLPVSGASVLLFSGDSLVTSCFTGADGLCVFEHLSRGTYRVEARKEFYEGSGATVDVPEDQAVDVELPIMSLVPPSGDVYTYSRVHACVYKDADGEEPVAGALVRDMRGSYSCTTFGDGCCHIDRVRRDIDLYWYARTDTLFSSIKGPVRFSSSTGELSIVVSPASGTAVRLKTVDPRAGYEPVSGLEAEMSGPGDFHIQGLTDSGGRVLFSPVAPDTDYSVRIGTSSSQGPDGITWSASQSVNISRYDIAESRILPVTLPFTGIYASVEEYSDERPADSSSRPSIEFTVTDTADRPVPGAQIHIRQNGAAYPTVVTDGNGFALVSDLLPGTVEIKVVLEGYQGVGFEEVLASGQTLRRYIRIVPVITPQVEYADRREGAQGGDGSTVCPAVAVTVKNPSDGNVVGGLHARLLGMASGNILGSGTVSANGTMVFTSLDLEEQPMELRLSRESTNTGQGGLEWRELSVLSPLVARDGYYAGYTFYFLPDSTDVSMTSTGGGNPLLVTGDFTVVDENGRPVPDCSITVVSLDDMERFDLVSDDQGRASFTHDLPGRYRITTVTPGYEGVEYEISMGVGTVYSFNIKNPHLTTILRPVYDSCTDGSVPDPGLKSDIVAWATESGNGQPVSGISMVLASGQGSELASGLTGSDGSWRAEGLGPAQGLLLEAASPSPSGDWSEIVRVPCSLRAGMETRVRLFTLSGGCIVSATPLVQEISSGDDASIFIHVSDLSGSPVKRAKINLNDAGGRMLRTLYTNDSGNADIRHISPGLYGMVIAEQGHVTVNVDNISIWQGSSPRWHITLPDVMDYVKGLPEESSESARLEALVVNGDTFMPLAGATAEITPVGSRGSEYPGAVRSDSSGRLVISGLDSTGPVRLTLSMNNYMRRTEGPMQLDAGEVRYALYALAPAGPVESVANPDNVPAGRTVWFPADNTGVVNRDGGLVVFSYDYVRASVNRKARADLPSAASSLMAGAPLPVQEGGGRGGAEGYLLAVRVSPSRLNLYLYSPEAGNTVDLAAAMNVSGEIRDVLFSGKNILVGTSSGLFFYTLSAEDGGVDPVLQASIPVPVLKISGMGTGIVAVTEEGSVVGIDASVWSMPVSRSLGISDYLPRNMASTANYLLLADETDVLHVARASGTQLFNPAQAGNQSVPGLWFTAQEQLDARDINRIRIVAAQGRTYGYVLVRSGVYVVELTDNAMLQTAFYPMPGAPQDIVPVSHRVDNSTRPAYLVLTDSGFYLIPPPDGAVDSIGVDLDVTALLPRGTAPRFVWTSGGHVQPLEQQYLNGSMHYFWRGGVSSGVYDVIFTDSLGNSLFAYYGAELGQSATGQASSVEPGVTLMRSDGSRASSFSPGQEIHAGMDLAVLSDVVVDAYLVVTFRPDGSEQKYYCPAVMGPGGYLQIESCHEGMAQMRPFLRSWPATPFSGMKTRLVSLPPGRYGGSGEVSFFLVPPGTGPDDEDAVYGRAVVPFRVAP